MGECYEIETFKVRLAVSEPGEGMTGSRSAQPIIRAIYADLDADKEHFVLLALNNKNRLNGFKLISTGSLTASLVHPREVYRAALHFCAAAVIFVHNHPSGVPDPSEEDIELTRQLVSCGNVLGIRILDHIVLGREESFFSFSDRFMLGAPPERPAAPIVAAASSTRRGPYRRRSQLVEGAS